MSSRLRVLTHLIDRWRHPKGWRLVAAVLTLIALLAATTQLTYAGGGTRNVYLHASYIPVVLAASWFRTPGGLIAGLAAGLLLGPFMPLDVGSGTMQMTAAWMYRLGFFMLIGGIMGQMSHLLNLRLDQLQRALDNLSQTYAQTLKALSSLIAYRDEDTAGHCDRVAHNARAIGEELGLQKAELDDLYWAGILHDLGKVATPTEILLKPGPLTNLEFDKIKEHAAVGSDLLLNVSPVFRSIAAGVRSHHEHWDGQGYPDGLKGAEIPLFGRILAVVDVFEALTSRRPYRGPMDASEARDYLGDQAGRQFDPEIVHSFEQAFRKGRIHLAGHEPITPRSRTPIRLDVNQAYPRTDLN